MKKSMVLIELIFTIAIFSVIALYSMNIALNISTRNHALVNDLDNILKLEATKLFIQKHPLSTIEFVNGSLIYNKEHLLLKNVASFKLSSKGNLVSIDICLDNNAICQNWIIK